MWEVTERSLLPLSLFCPSHETTWRNGPGSGVDCALHQVCDSLSLVVTDRNAKRKCLAERSEFMAQVFGESCRYVSQEGVAKRPAIRMQRVLDAGATPC
jgi:hypothetical protein